MGVSAETEAPAGATVVLVSGPSGAGRTTAINCLEDLGCETINNLPLSLVPRLLDGAPGARPLVLGVDTRNRDFSVPALLDLIDGLRAREPGAELLYLDASADVLLRRFSETRRRHPMAPAETPAEGIARELDLLGPIRARADLLIDTSELTPHDLRREIGHWFGPNNGARLTVTLHSFSYKRGMPRGIDMVFDCRFLRNPYWVEALRARDGRDPAVAAHIGEDPRFGDFFDKVRDLVLFLLPAYRAEGKSHLSVGFGCTGGQHRSVLVSERIAAALRDQGWQVGLRHHELVRKGLIDRSPVPAAAPVADAASAGGRG